MNNDELSKTIEILANRVGCDLSNPDPVDLLAIKTVAFSNIKSSEESFLNCNSLAKYDTIILTFYLLRLLCMSNINNRENAINFSNKYVTSVLRCFPLGKTVSQNYNADIFAERTYYYDSIFEKSNPEDRLQNILEDFKYIITYDYMNNYVDFNKTKSIPIIGIELNVKISAEINSYIGALTNVFNSSLESVQNKYNSQPQAETTKVETQKHSLSFFEKSLGTLIVILIVSCVGIGFSNWFEHYNSSNSPKTKTTAQHEGNDTSINDNSNKIVVIQEEPEPEYKECEKPSNGTLSHTYAPYSYNTSILGIELPVGESDTYYYIKLVEPETNDTVQSVFLYPGRTLEFNVPCGTYKLKYGCGDKWYGYEHLFGPKGAYTESDELLDFTNEYGHTITLYPVINGNFSTDSIDYEDF